MNINNENKAEIINMYLSGELQGDSLQEFLKTMEEDLLLKQEVALQKMLVHSIHQAGRIKLRAELEEIHNNIKTNEPNANTARFHLPYIVKRYGIGIAASLSVLILLTFVILNSKQSNNSILFTEYFTPYPNVVYTTYRNPSESTIPDEKRKAFEAYDQKNYTVAIKTFERLKDDKDEIVLFYLANSYLATDQPQKAISIFSEYHFREFKIESTWYLALSYLKTGDSAKAKEILKKIASEDNDYATRAQELLNVLK